MSTRFDTTSYAPDSATLPELSSPSTVFPAPFQELLVSALVHVTDTININAAHVVAWTALATVVIAA